MESQPQRNTEPELLIRSALHRLGLRYRIHAQPLPGLRRHADLLFASARVAVFVDGCYWHGCPIHGTWSKANAAFWRQKIEANRRRDRDTNGRLRRAGWTVVRVWEHEPPNKAAGRIARIVTRKLARRSLGE